MHLLMIHPPYLSASLVTNRNDWSVLCLFFEGTDNNALSLNVGVDFQALTLGSSVNVSNKGARLWLEIFTRNKFPCLSIQDRVPIILGTTTTLVGETEMTPFFHGMFLSVVITCIPLDVSDG